VFALVEVGDVVQDLGVGGVVGLVQLGVDVAELGAEPACQVGDGGHAVMFAAWR
jgi:hypothetical protein